MNKTIRKNHEYYWSAIIDDEPEKTNSEGSLRVLKEMGDISVKPGLTKIGWPFSPITNMSAGVVGTSITTFEGSISPKSNIDWVKIKKNIYSIRMYM